MNVGTLTIEMAANVARLSKDMDAARRTVERTFGSIEKDVARLKDLLGGLFAGLSASAFVGKLVEVQRQFDVLNSSLITVTGSSAAAAREFAWIKQFAATTPFQLAEVTGAFVKMKALGLDASQAALTSYGNTASAMGKSLNQMIEAVADAATGEFERLKEFGIKAKQQGDQVTLTFQGVSKTIGNNAAEITAYLQAIGENEFAGAMAQRAQTLDGAISNLADTWDELFRTISQQSAGGLIYDSVKLASGAIEDMITILNALNGATAENAKQTGAMKVIQEGIAIVFETVAVLGVNLKYVLVQIGREIGGLAAQAEQYVRGGLAVGILFDVLTKGYSEEWNAIKAIRAEMVKDAAAARKEVDALSERILRQRERTEQMRQALKSLDGVDTRAEDARLMRHAGAIQSVGQAAASTRNAVKTMGDEFAAQREAAKAWADAYQDFARIAAQATDESLGLTKAQARLVEFLGSPAYASASEPMRQLALEQAYTAITAEQNAAAQEQQAKALEAASRADLERIEALERNAASAEEQLQRLLDEERALLVAAEKNIALAQAIEEVAIARLREQQAALMREGDRDAEVLAIQREIDARKRLIEAIGRKEARDAATESAREAAREWQRTAENIERSLTDALLRGFESGKDFARNLRDTIVNMFKSLVIRPVIQAIVAPVAGGITGALGLPGTANAAQGAMGGFNMISGIKSVYDTIMGGFTGLGNSVAFAAQDIGAWLVNNTTGVLNRFGGSLMANAGTLGTVGSYLGGAGAGLASGKLISGGYSAIGKSGNTANVVGTAIGAILGGPIGAAIGGAIGGLVNRTFGRKLKDTGIEGTFSGDGFTGNIYQFYKGGWFRSNKTKTSPLDPGLDKALDQQFMVIKSSVVSMAQALGIAGTALDGFTTDIKVSFKGLTEQQIQGKLAETLGGVGDKMAASLLEGADAVIRTGETAGEALRRLGGSLLVVNEAFDAMGLATLNASVASGDLASSVVDAFGSLDAFTQATSAYYEAMYSQTERTGEAMSDMVAKFDALGVSVPASAAAFRDLVAAQDLATASGREMFSQLVQLGPAFADLMTQMQQSIGLTADALRGVFQSVLSEAKSAEEARMLGEQAAGEMLMQAISDAMINTVTDLVGNAILQPLTQSIVGAAAQAATIDVAAAAAAGSNLAAGGAAAGSNLAAGGAAGGANVAAGGAAAGQGLAEIVGKAISVTNAMVEILNNADFRQAFGNAVSAIGSISAGLYTGMSGISSSISFSGGGAWGGGGGGGGGGQEDDSTKRLADLLDEKRQLEIRLLEAQGKKQEALNKIREDAIDGLTAEAVAVYDANRALEEQIRVQEALNDFATEGKRLQAQLLELQGDAEGAKEILRALAIEGLTELEIAAYDANEALRAQIRALQERSSLEERLLQLRGDTAALRAKELSEVDASNRHILERIYAIEDARAATDAAYSALERAIDAQRRSAEVVREVAREQVDSVAAVFDVLKSNIEELYNEAASTSAMSAAAGQAFIAQALATARSTGYLPDSNELAQAIRAARGGLDSDRYASAFEAERDRLVLAGRLSQLREISGNQLTIAEQQLKIAEQQLESLDGQLATARAQLDAMRGVDQRVLSVEQAIRELNAAMVAELRALAAAAALAAADAAAVRAADSAPSAPTVNPQMLEAAKALYYSTHGGYPTPLFDAAVAPFGGFEQAFQALGWDGSREGAAAIRAKYGFAAGGLHDGGVRMVGENGPEIEVTGPARYYSAGQTAAMLGGGAAVANEVRQLREENQAQARAMVQLQARVTRLLERWDGDGMPETRSVTA